MILEKTLLTASAQLPKLAGLALSFPSNSLMGELYTLSLPVIPLNINQDTPPLEAQQRLASAIAGLTNPSDGVGLHNKEQDALRVEIGRLVSGQVSYIRNVIKPAYIRLLENLARWKASAAIPPASSNFNIIQLFAPAVMGQATFINNVESYAGSALKTPAARLDFGERGHDELIEMVKYGTSRIDELVVEDVLGDPDHILAMVWRTFFGKYRSNTEAQFEISRLEGSVVNYPDINKLYPHDAMRVTLYGYLLALNLIKNPPAEYKGDLKGMTYFNAMYQVRDYFGGMLNAIWERYSKSMNTRTLVTGYLPSQNTIVVDRDLYRDWLKSGGAPELLYGLMLSKEWTNYGDAILRRSEELRATWRAHCGIWETKERLQAVDTYRTQLLNLFEADLVEIDDREKEYFDTHPGYVDELRRQARDYIKDIRTSEMDNDEEHARMLIAKIRFAYTPGYDYLTDMLEASKLNSNITIKEASTIAAIKYLCRWTVSMMTVTKR